MADEQRQRLLDKIETACSQDELQLAVAKLQAFDDAQDRCV